MIRWYGNKRYKQADILIIADKYKNKVLKKEYDALLCYEVMPYVEKSEADEWFIEKEWLYMLNAHMVC